MSPIALGIHDAIPPELYHADALTEEITLSRSGIHTLLTGTPAQFAAKHPRLTQWPETLRNDSTDATDLGEIVHAMVLGVGAPYIVRDCHEFLKPDGTPYTTWSGKAKEWRDQIRAEGFVQIGSDQYRMAAGIVDRLLTALRDRFPTWDQGKSEQTILWPRKLNTGKVITCRARVDRLLPDGTIIDVKSTALGVSSAELGKSIGMGGLDIQHEFYREGVAKALGLSELPPFVFAYVRTVPPYEIRFVHLDGTDWLLFGDDGPEVPRPRWPLRLTRQRIDRAAHIFGACLTSGTWPDALVDVAPEPPAWLGMQWADEALEEEG